MATLDAQDAVALATALSAASLKEHGGEYGFPALVLVDEVVSAADANPYRLGLALRETMALRRHRHVGLVWTCQSPNLAHYQMLCIGTELVVFRLTNERDLTPLQRAGFSDEELYTVRNLPNYSYVVHRLD